MYLIFREQIDKINSTKVPYKEDTPVGNNYPEIRELLQQKADYQARLNLLPYDGSPEIKEQGGKQYLYIRKADPADREAVGSAGLHGIRAVRPGHTEY